MTGHWPRAALFAAALAINTTPAWPQAQWTGDLDAMVERRIVRVLVVPNRTNYFQDKAAQGGATYDAFRIVERRLNAGLDPAGKQPKVEFVFVPVRREEMLDALVEGKGDIGAATLMITPERLARVDFTAPLLTGVREVLVTGPASPAVGSLDGLSGKKVFVRRSSSYFQSLQALNAKLAARKMPPVILEEAPEPLEDENLIEMLDAGLVSLLVVDKKKADYWAKVYPKVKVRDDIVLREDGEIAWAIRKGSPQWKAFLGRLIGDGAGGNPGEARDPEFARYLESLHSVKDARSSPASANSTSSTSPAN